MDDCDLQQLKLVFADVQGHAAVEGLLNAIETKEDSIGLINHENDLIVAASRVFKESSSSCSSISGKEVRAHGVLRSILLEYKSGGVPALQSLRKTLCPMNPDI